MLSPIQTATKTSSQTNQKNMRSLASDRPKTGNFGMPVTPIGPPVNASCTATTISIRCNASVAIARTKPRSFRIGAATT